MEKIARIVILFMLLLVLASVIYAVNIMVKLNKLENLLDIKNNELKNLSREYREKIKIYENFISNLGKEEKSKEPTWDELKNFLILDKTNELIYNEKSFDCSGFAIELFKKARKLGYKVALVEIEFENSSQGHMLNAFKTSDKGIIYIDDTGNENGTGKDKLAYVEIGKPYITITLSKVKDNFVNCNISCENLSKSEISYKKFNITSYEFFSNLERCYNLLNTCINQYNKEVEKFNSGISNYSYNELNLWLNNLKTLKKGITLNEYIIINIGEVVKNIQIYW